MSRKIFVNLPVADLARSKAFYGALGFGFDARFTNDDAACVVFGEHVFAMLLTHEQFMRFSPLPIADPRAAAQVLNCLSCASRAEVNELVSRAVAAGGATFGPPTEHGDAMYSHDFSDPDGHGWGLMWMDPAAIAATPA